ncbi:MAG: PfkB family carbohydrate kinase [Candidatus Zapsychrus exili]|nr:PfkB family carbohydrate kinase [Candidatus Zapsychrus exili]
MQNYAKIISKFSKKNILVIGDIILDQYIQGSVSRISPEAPVPIVLEENSFSTPGGAANVAHNLRSLGANVTLAGMVGKDPEGEILRKELSKKGINTKAVFVDSKLPTILKLRIIAQHQQVVRVDKEKFCKHQSKIIFKKITDFLKRNIKNYDAIIVSDYGKGLISKELISFVCSLAEEKNKIITVDPKVENFNYYRKVTAITPNRSEAENAIRNIKITADSSESLAIRTEKLTKDSDINLAGNELLKYLELESLLITLGENGMRLFEKGKKPHSIKTKAQEVHDVSGAGDAVISAFTLSLTAGSTKIQAAEISNFAGGIVVGKMGAVAVTKKELLEAIKSH